MHTFPPAEPRGVAVRDRIRDLPNSPRSSASLADPIWAFARCLPDRTALIDPAESLTWAAFADRCRAMARGLNRLGVGRGDVVAVADRLCVDYVCLYYATAHIGAVLVPLNISLPAAGVGLQVRRTRPMLIACAAEFRPLLDDVAVPVAVSSVQRTWGRSLCQNDDGLPSGGGDLDDPHLIIFTSGTTGVPKAAVLSQRGTQADAYAGALAAGLRATDRLYAYQPPYHTGTWSIMRQYVLVGASMVLAPSFDPQRAIEAFQRHRCTCLFAVPLVLQDIVDAPAFAQADLSSLRHVVFASYDATAVVGPALKRIRTQGAARLTAEHIYGLTENSAFISTARAEDCEHDLGTVGTPVPGVTVTIRAPDGAELPRGETGEICVRSQSVMMGYLDDEAATATAFEGGWLHTGDLGTIGSDGMLRIIGRLKEMIRTAGVNVYPREIAATLAEHPAVRDCAVFGVRDDRYDERVVAAVTPRDGHAVTEAEITTWLRLRLAGYQTPRQVLVLAELPKTPAGKTATTRLIELAEGAHARRVTDTTA
ncbi:AMP-binding protein [Pseudonocardia kujensis]|uniref:class I adenylate-forming enzyme family protein n=1 Tax=Pseudonocardia kujensis TaxID=1128675 RepID=UPI001E2856F0|nr:AMP-binding protein [Pseudonocardia kujensis]MCE0767615.1 AMP-binding protein [Pseudonocardia kujensis]